MIKRTIEISERPMHVSVKHGQLVLRPRKDDDSKPATIPCEDIGMIVVDECSTTYTHAALAALLEHGAAVVLCGADHLPAGLLLPVSGNQLLTQRLARQVAASKPLCKRLWKQIVQCKIRHQAHALGREHHAYRKLRTLEREVRSGDPGNVEAQAAKIYWKGYLGEHSFRRDPGGAAPNNLLNYGYAVMRAAVARAICSAGLHPSIGLHHHNRYNAFCLADDLMEPLRPTVDHCVARIWESGLAEISRDSKAELLGLLTVPIRLGGREGPLMIQLHRMAASLCQCFEGSRRDLELPQP